MSQTPPTAEWANAQTIEARSGAQLTLRQMAAKGAAKGVVQFNHGAAEHSGRYGEFAERLSAAGFHVFAHDHRGHGQTTVPGLAPHTFGKHGWDLVIEDIECINRHIDTLHPDLPRIVMGHSMGSIAAFEYALRQPARPHALVLLGPVLAKNAALPVLRLLMRTEAAFKAPGSTSTLFQKLGWDPLNKPFEPARTPYDWLTRDTAEVDAYIADPECGWPPTMNFAQQMMRGVAATYKDARLKALNPAMPVLLMSGAEDPSTNMAKSVPELDNRLKAAGVTTISTAIFDGMRHELHNETGRDAVYEKLTHWCAGAV